MVYVLIEADAGLVSDDYSFYGFVGASNYAWGNEEHEIKLISIKGLSMFLATHLQDIHIPVGSLDFVRKVAQATSVQLPNPLNIPDVLLGYVSRKVWTSTVDNLSYPCFVKPLVDVKAFQGTKVYAKEDLLNINGIENLKGDLWCSEFIDGIESEWRCYIVDGKILDCCHYSGNPLQFPDKDAITNLVAHYKDAPRGYALDVCIANGVTQLVECNDGWALGAYGGNPVNYFSLIKARWEELMRK